jgi:hypothetical protein
MPLERLEEMIIEDYISITVGTPGVPVVSRDLSTARRRMSLALGFRTGW